MFQKFDDISNPENVAPRLAALREKLEDEKLDGFIIPHTDEYQNEYLAPYAERLAWVTGFTGSAGLAVVLKEKAALFVDGRYTLQAPKQTDTGAFEVCHITEKTTEAWLEENLSKGQKLGFDPWLHSEKEIKRFEKVCEKKEALLTPLSHNPLDHVWQDQPSRPQAPAQIHEIQFSGKESRKKRDEIAATLTDSGVDILLITKPETICWLFNIRGRDISHTPLILSYALLYGDGTADIFLDPNKISSDVRAFLGVDVTIKSPDSLEMTLKGLEKSAIQIDPALTPYWFLSQFEKAGTMVVRKSDPCALPKACKNETELKGMRTAHERDGAALTRFLCWLEQEGSDGSVDEINVVKRLEAFRAETNALQDISFETISGSGPHGAIVHYRVSESSNRRLQKGELFLVDSGAQYKDGTTDVTRTIAIGTPTAEMRERFTRVLKGHIALSSARFPEGSTGSMLDTLARNALWQAGLDFDHGTGHGVGAFLGVHEGPQNISRRSTATKLEPGMILSNEPGYYKEGEYGIRIENLVEVKEATSISGGDRPMMSFEPLTLAPIDLTLVDQDLLSDEEINWLNDYHTRVRKTLSPLVDKVTTKWLLNATRTL